MDDRNPSPKTFGLPLQYRPRQSAAVWKNLPADWRTRLKATVEDSIGTQSPSLFFRADDIGAGGCAFDALCRLFRHFRVPLAMAVVPGWLSGVRTTQLFRSAPPEEPLWGWHQHGWRHINWQKTGRKSEFGEERPFEKQRRDLCLGLKKMEQTFGDNFQRLFTPPWNSLSSGTLRILREFGYQGISTDGPLPKATRSSVPLLNLRIHLDLHTRKGKDPREDFRQLLDELAAALARKEPAGIMIHHQRMNPPAFEFLCELLALLTSRNEGGLPHISSLLEHPHEG